MEFVLRRSEVVPDLLGRFKDSFDVVFCEEFADAVGHLLDIRQVGCG